MREEIIKDGWTDVIGEHDSENGAPVPKGTGKLPGLTSFEENVKSFSPKIKMKFSSKLLKESEWVFKVKTDLSNH